MQRKSCEQQKNGRKEHIIGFFFFAFVTFLWLLQLFFFFVFFWEHLAFIYLACELSWLLIS